MEFVKIHLLHMEANPVKMRPQCFYSTVTENLKLDHCMKLMDNASFQCFTVVRVKPHARDEIGVSWLDDNAINK